MEYLRALKEEIEITKQQYPFEEIHSIFVGGGTPTTLTSEQMSYFLEFSNELLQPREKEIEFTMEANPERISVELLNTMYQGGVNRLSFGVQTFDEGLLKKLGRLHSPEDVYRSVSLSKDVGFRNISIDLMFGLPNQTVQMLEDSIDKVLELGVSHVSAYSLKIEEGTFYHKLYTKEKLSLPSEEEEVEMYELLIKKLSAHGLKQYEISNFARPGFESKHNLTYWKNNEYYGFGAGAHGYINGIRHVNAGPIDEYIELVKRKGLPSIETHQVQKNEAMEDMMIMGLRLAQGVSKNEFFQRYAVHIEEAYGEELNALYAKELLAIDGDHIFLTHKGKFLGNEVFATFLRDVNGEH